MLIISVADAVSRGLCSTLHWHCSDLSVFSTNLEALHEEVTTVAQETYGRVCKGFYRQFATSLRFYRQFVTWQLVTPLCFYRQFVTSLCFYRQLVTSLCFYRQLATSLRIDRVLCAWWNRSATIGFVDVCISERQSPDNGRWSFRGITVTSPTSSTVLSRNRPTSTSSSTSTPPAALWPCRPD